MRFLWANNKMMDVTKSIGDRPQIMSRKNRPIFESSFPSVT